MSSEDIRAGQAEAYGYINRALPDADLDQHVWKRCLRKLRYDRRE